jgi:hypothetical protein
MGCKGNFLNNDKAILIIVQPSQVVFEVESRLEEDRTGLSLKTDCLPKAPLSSSFAMHHHP